jgi:capsular polysaccharide biosynthesis protein
VTEPDRIVRSNAEFLNSPAVMDRVVALTDGRLTHERLEEQVNVEPTNDADLITIRAGRHAAGGS